MQFQLVNISYHNYKLQERFIIGFIGSLNEYEGLDLLIEAVKNFLLQDMKLSLLIVGDGTARAKLERLAKSTIDGLVIFTNFRENRTKIVDFSLILSFCARIIFYY